mmetsp:Transcript_17800/g.29864  ORF Transcript_17800/g.29864 Transcript_17800/m.29864 type:complete len:175 (+) Transcript_17800:301-825(+)
MGRKVKFNGQLDVTFVPSRAEMRKFPLWWTRHQLYESINDVKKEAKLYEVCYNVSRREALAMVAAADRNIMEEQDILEDETVLVNLKSRCDESVTSAFPQSTPCCKDDEVFNDGENESYIEYWLPIKPSSSIQNKYSHTHKNIASNNNVYRSLVFATLFLLISLSTSVGLYLKS